MNPSSLKDICGVAVVTEFCLQPEVKKIVLSRELNFRTFSEWESAFDWLNSVLKPKCENFVKDLPHSIRKNLPYYLIPLIGIEIIEWVKYHISKFNLTRYYCLNFIRRQHFKANGTVDKRLAATELVNDKSIPAFSRFKVASYYFLTEYFQTLWDELTEQEKHFFDESDFFDINKGVLSIKSHPFSNLTDKLIKRLKIKDMSKICDSIHKHVVFVALYGGNEVAFKYNFHELDSSSKNYVAIVFKTFLPNIFVYNSFQFYFLYKPYIEMLTYILFNLERDKPLKPLLDSKYYAILKLILFWPHQGVFIKVSKMVWQNVKNFEFYIFLHLIVDFITDERFCYSFDYIDILTQFWNISSPDYRKYVLSIESGANFNSEDQNLWLESINQNSETIFEKGFLFKRIIRFKDFNNDYETIIEMMLKNATQDEIQKIVAKQGDNIFQNVLSF